MDEKSINAIKKTAEEYAEMIFSQNKIGYLSDRQKFVKGFIELYQENYGVA